MGLNMAKDLHDIHEQLATLNRQMIDCTRLLHIIIRQHEQKLTLEPPAIALVTDFAP